MTTSTVEDYLKCIFQAETETPSRVSTGAIAAALNVAPGTATAMVKTLAESGLVDYEPYGGVRLTAAGTKLAAHVLRRHRVIELFLVRIMGMNWSEVHEDAERLEHAVSDVLLDRMDEMLGRPSADPHGDPIPTPHGILEEQDHASLTESPSRVDLRVARVTDQSAEFLRLMEKHGVMPGNILRIESREPTADAIVLKNQEGRRFTLGFRPAAHVLVERVRKGR